MQACGTVTTVQLSSRRCGYDPHFPSLYMFITRSLFSCCWYSGKVRSNGGANVSRIKKHLKQIYKNFQSSNTEMSLLFLLPWIRITCSYSDSEDAVTWTGKQIWHTLRLIIFLKEVRKLTFIFNPKTSFCNIYLCSLLWYKTMVHYKIQATM
jgi:hypothetical protein